MINRIEHIFKPYAKLLATVDDWFGRCVVKAGSAITCRSGCSQCCRGLFDITLLDACYLKAGFYLLSNEVKAEVLRKSEARLSGIMALWPEFAPPYLLNYRPDEEWEEILPQEDETPCVLLGADNRCMVYDYRPMTCRLHGLPLVDFSGEVLDDAWCTLNFVGGDPLTMTELRGEFTKLFKNELVLFHILVEQLLKLPFSELDTVIPTALLIDFAGFDWDGWLIHNGEH